MNADQEFRQRYWQNESIRQDDERDEYQRDKARVIHSAAFRRLQAKTQVMGVGEGDFHRTRLTHSIEAAQIGEGILNVLKNQYAADTEIAPWLPTSDLVAAACYAHDLGHPPFGHGGEKALHQRMVRKGGFEGNGQTLRIITRLEKYKRGRGMNPTRRLVLSVLKYPIRYTKFSVKERHAKPPKCYFDEEHDIVQWALGTPFTREEVRLFTTAHDEKGKPLHRTLDCSIMECADDIAYAVHDLEDIVSRHLVHLPQIVEKLDPTFRRHGPRIGSQKKGVTLRVFKEKLFSNSYDRKELISTLVNLFVTSVRIRKVKKFAHPLLMYRLSFDAPIEALLKALKDLTFDLVVQRAEVQQLESRGKRVVGALFDELLGNPRTLIPDHAWEWVNEADSQASTERHVCDYIAGMTDRYAEKIYQRLFVPGIGSSHDEL